MTALDLGGPGPRCSVTALRRLRAGELAAAERARLEEHLLGCSRCQARARELEEEERVLAEQLPFDRFAAGVAERAAAYTRARPRWLRALPLAIAALLAVGVAVPLVSRLAPAPDPDVRLKGGPVLTVYAQAAQGGPRVLGEGDAVPPEARLRVALPPSDHAYAAVLLVDRDGAAVVYQGKAVEGPLPGAFTWTGGGRGKLVAVLGDTPVDAAALAARLSAHGADAAREGGREVVVRELRAEGAR